MAKHRLNKYERETILLTSEGDDTWDIYTFNTDLKNRLKKFAARYPELCTLREENKELGSVTYIIQKSRVSIHLNSPQSEARRKAASEIGKQKGFHGKSDNYNEKTTTGPQSHIEKTMGLWYDNNNMMKGEC